MADKKVTELPEVTDVSDTDIIYLVDDPSVIPVSSKAQVDNIARVAYGQVTLTDGSNVTALTSGVWAFVDAPDTASLVNHLVTEDAAGGRLRPNRIGRYMATLTVSFSGPGGTTFDFALNYDGSQLLGQVSQRLEGSGYGKSAQLIVLYDATSEVADLRIEAKADASVSLTVTDCVLTTTRIG